MLIHPAQSLGCTGGIGEEADSDSSVVRRIRVRQGKYEICKYQINQYMVFNSLQIVFIIKCSTPV